MLALVAREPESQAMDLALDSAQCVEDAQRLLIAANGAETLDNLQANLLLVSEAMPAMPAMPAMYDLHS